MIIRQEDRVPEEGFVSKSQKKREMDALQGLGKELVELPADTLKTLPLPDDLREATRAFHLDTRQRWTKLILPAVFGSWCTGGITAAGGAWNASIVSEIVTYGHTTLTANGLGTYIANATAVGDTGKTIIGVAVMSVFVVGVNRLFWRPLQAYAERRFSVA